MNPAFHILGHSNSTLALVLDTLLARYPADPVRVTIVSNMAVDDDTPYDFADVPRLRLTEITSREWDGQWENLLLGVLQAKTKRAVLASFQASHSVVAGQFHLLVHPSAVVANATSLSPGVHVGPGAAIAPYAVIGSLTSISRQASVGHHTVIGDCCTLNPGCNVAGHCRIGDDVTIGMGANIVDHATIGSNTVIGAGAVVTRSLPSDVVAWGVPARIIERRDR
jgi:sugar O-acyltransferase (sialic acid O-acetyltransferase NeuD family)